MRPILVVVFLAVTSGTAAAQMVPPPMIEEPKMMAGVSGTVWIPQGDADDFSETSIGIRPSFAYHVYPWLAILGTFDFIFVNEKEGNGDITYYNINAGARLVRARPGSLEPYGEFLLGYHQLDAEGFDDSGIGFRIGGGVFYPLGQKLIANLALNYSAVSIDTGFVDVDVDALIIELGLGMRF